MTKQENCESQIRNFVI